MQYAERRKPIVFWVGSGLSVNANLPNWPQLKTALVSAALDAATALGGEAGKIADARIEAVRVEPNPWEAFRSLKNIMGDTEYHNSIRAIFDKSANIPPPDMYYLIWSLKIDGILSLNIDGFAHRAFPNSKNEEVLIFNGRDAKNYVQAISGGRKFVANLHGEKANSSTWVFTRDELNSLVSDAAYVAFLNFVFSSMTIIFVGISAEDTAAGGFLQNLRSSGLDVGPHFWITDRSDTQAHEWSAKNNVQIIKYTPDRDINNKINHDIPLGEIFETIREYVSTEGIARAVIPQVKASASRLTPLELRQKSDDETRHVLASYARDILDRNGSNTACQDYRDFLRIYSSSIFRSWHISNYEGDDRFFDYRVIEKISSSAFSNVWRLMNEQGDNFALKVIQIDNLHSGTQLESFRRGVRSMEFLTNADVPGTPKLVSAHEIPTCVIMSFIEGHNLGEIVKRPRFDFWSDGTRILINVCKNLQYGHNLPQGVLHRDVRPSNIMVPNYHYSELEASDHGVDKYEASLINYDMSWHVNAQGNTITGNLEEAGFYSPEMINGVHQNTARRTSVDAYGIGMTLYFSYTKSVPPSGGSKSTDWQKLLDANFRASKDLTWHSAPNRLRRIIEAATRPNEDERIAVGVIGSRLEMVLRAAQGRFDEISTDFWAEELLIRAFSYRDYKANPEETEFSHEPIPGRLISIKANFRQKSLEMRFENASTGSADRSSGKAWGERLGNARSILKSSGWRVLAETGRGALNIVLSATIEVDEIRADIAKAAKNLDRAIDQVRVD